MRTIIGNTSSPLITYNEITMSGAKELVFISCRRLRSSADLPHCSTGAKRQQAASIHTVIKSPARRTRRYSGEWNIVVKTVLSADIFILRSWWLTIMFDSGERSVLPDRPNKGVFPLLQQRYYFLKLLTGHNNTNP
jgi:hypothetical protein